MRTQFVRVHAYTCILTGWCPDPPKINRSRVVDTDKPATVPPNLGERFSKSVFKGFKPFCFISTIERFTVANLHSIVSISTQSDFFFCYI